MATAGGSFGSGGGAGSFGVARWTCKANGDRTIASRRGSPLVLATADCPVAIAPAGAATRSVKPSLRRSSAAASGRSSTVATSNSGVIPSRLSVGVFGQALSAYLIVRPAPTFDRVTPVAWPSVV